MLSCAENTAVNWGWGNTDEVGIAVLQRVIGEGLGENMNAGEKTEGSERGGALCISE